ncbi:MAG TPA: dipeptidase [Candidatus Dormibacteraeota bacterium]|nr:dipeptidase [Candidatus Dormibacteraeota bacterium]
MAIDAAALHREAIVIDGLDYSYPTRERFLRMRKAGLTAAHVTLAAFENYTQVASNFVLWERAIDENPDVLMRVRTLDDIFAAKSSGKVGIIFGFQNATPIEDELAYIGVFRKLGVRIIQLAYMYQNLLGAGCLEPRDPGLSAFGKDVVRELNRQRIAVDLSHCGPLTTMEAIEVSERPVLFTHANPRAVVDTPRNKSDEALRLLAERGGVVGAVTFPTFVAPKDPTIEDWFRHVDYLVDLVGEDHVSIGTDFVEGQPEGFLDRGLGRYVPAGMVPTWPWIYPEGIRTVDDFPNITEGLVKRGYRADAITKILGGNLLRVFREIWDAA